jgi:benzoate-CoA ligase family protein
MMRAQEVYIPESYKDKLYVPKGYLEIPERFNMGVHACDRHVQEGRGDKVAIYDGNERITFLRLSKLQNKFGNALKKLGISKGDSFIIRSVNSVEVFVAILGGLKIGAVPVPTNTMFKVREIEHILNNSDAVMAISTPDMVDVIENVQGKCPKLKHIVIFGEAKDKQLAYEDLMKDASEELEACDTHKDDLAFMLYTSGTTGSPKGVCHAHRWSIGEGDPIAIVAQHLTPNDIVLQPQEISFMYPFGHSFFFPFHQGAGIVLYKGRFDAERVYEHIEKYKVTVFCGVPTLYRMLLALDGVEKKYNLSSLRICESSGEPLPKNTFDEWKNRFKVNIYDCFGQTEGHQYIGNVIGVPINPGSMGKPFPGIKVGVVDQDQNECPVNEVGDLVIDRNHPGLLLEYRKNPEKMAEVMRGNWYYTGDKAYMDENGYIWHASRSDDLIKSRGYLISPKEVEEATVEHEAVLEVACVGSPDDTIGQKVKIFVVLKAGYKKTEALGEEILAKVRSLIAPYKAPKLIEFMDELPKTSTGKIKRKDLKELEEKRAKAA